MAPIAGTNSWVTLNSPGVPSGGRYGDPRGFAKRGARYGFKLAWDTLWERFFMYSVDRDGVIIPHWPFSKDGGLTPQPITDEHLAVFIDLQQRYPGIKKTKERLHQMETEEKAKAQRAAKEEYDAIEDEVMRKVDLKMRLKTPNTSIIVPGMGAALN